MWFSSVNCLNINFLSFNINNIQLLFSWGVLTFSTALYIFSTSRVWLLPARTRTERNRLKENSSSRWWGQTPEVNVLAAQLDCWTLSSLGRATGVRILNIKRASCACHHVPWMSDVQFPISCQSCQKWSQMPHFADRRSCSHRLAWESLCLHSGSNNSVPFGGFDLLDIE